MSSILCHMALAASLCPPSGPASQPPTERLDHSEWVLGLDQARIPLRAPEKGALAIVFLWSECPISNRYSPTLHDLHSSWNGKPVTFVGVFVDPDRSPTDLLAHAREYQLRFPLALDSNGQLARRLSIETVPTAVVIDDQGEVRYRGRIDDQYFALGKNRPAATAHELQDAVEAVLEGKPVRVTHTEAVGCTLPTP